MEFHNVRLFKCECNDKPTLSPTCMGESPAKGILLVAISQRMRAKLYMSAAFLSISSGLCCRAEREREGGRKRWREGGGGKKETKRP